ICRQEVFLPSKVGAYPLIRPGRRHMLPHEKPAFRAGFKGIGSVPKWRAPVFYPISHRSALLIAVLVALLGASRFCPAQNVNSKGIWISNEELQAIPTSGTAWQYLKYRADQPSGIPKVSNQNDPENVQVLAKALVYARTGIESYRTQVIASVMTAMGTEK